MYPRKQYMDKLIAKKDNGRVKVITGLRRSGKSVLLFDLYRKYLLQDGIADDQIIAIALDELANAKYRNPIELDSFIRSKIIDSSKKYYVFIDEIQMVSEIPNPYVGVGEASISFIDVVLGLMKIHNVDVYVTGSNSKMLSSDIITQFRDRGDEIVVHPLSFAEFYDAVINYNKAIGSGYDGEINSEGYSEYWDVSRSEAGEIVVLYRSYTGAQIRYYVNPTTGDTYVTELVPGIIDEENKTEESFNVRDYFTD